MGNYLQKTGMPPNYEIWSLAALVDDQYHCKVIDAHKEYLKAGADIITTNSYAVTPMFLSRCGKLPELQSYIQLSVDLAQSARTQCQNQSGMIAGSIPPLQESFDAYGLLSEAESVFYYNLMVEQFKSSVVDLFLVETMTSYIEAKNVLNAMICNQLDRDERDIFLFFTLREDGMLRDGHRFDDAILKLEKYMDLLPISMIGANCCQPEAFEMMMDGMDKYTMALMKDKGISMGVYPNSYAPIPKGRKIGDDSILPEREDLPPDALYGMHFKRWIEKYGNDEHGLGLIGGCCGTVPQHIEFAVNAVNNDFPEMRPQKVEL